MLADLPGKVLIACGVFGWASNQTNIPQCPTLLQESDLARLHNDAIKNDPFISAALGPNPKVPCTLSNALPISQVARDTSRHASL